MNLFFSASTASFGAVLPQSAVEGELESPQLGQGFNKILQQVVNADASSTLEKGVASRLIAQDVAIDEVAVNQYSVLTPENSALSYSESQRLLRFLANEGAIMSSPLADMPSGLLDSALGKDLVNPSGITLIQPLASIQHCALDGAFQTSFIPLQLQDVEINVLQPAITQGEEGLFSETIIEVESALQLEDGSLEGVIPELLIHNPFVRIESAGVGSENQNGLVPSNTSQSVLTSQKIPVDLVPGKVFAGLTAVEQTGFSFESSNNQTSTKESVNKLADIVQTLGARVTEQASLEAFGKPSSAKPFVATEPPTLFSTFNKIENPVLQTSQTVVDETLAVLRSSLNEALQNTEKVTSETIQQNPLQQSQSQHTLTSAQLTFKGGEMPRQFPVNIHFGQAEWAGQVAERAAMMSLQKIQFAELRLDPPELGSLHVKVSVNHDQQAVVSFSSPHANVRDALDQSVMRLRELLEQQGLDLLDVNVSDQQSEPEQHEEFEDMPKEQANQFGEEKAEFAQPLTLQYGVDFYA